MSDSDTPQRLAPSVPGEPSPYPDDLDDSRRNERRVMWKEAAALTVVAVIIVVRQLWLI